MVKSQIISNEVKQGKKYQNFPEGQKCQIYEWRSNEVK
jgi:hypothetical protein